MPWCGNTESHFRLQGIEFLQPSILSMNVDRIMATKNLFGKMINIYLFEDKNGRICCFILAHALIQMKCSVFLVL